MTDGAPERNALPFKISTLIYVRNDAGDLLLLSRRKEPNRGMWSPIGGKLEMSRGESPFEAARRETLEEIGLELCDRDLHLFAMISEKHYEARCHWLMFLFDCKPRVNVLPPEMDEGRFAFHSPDALPHLPIPETDRKALWPAWLNYRDGFASMRADCHPEKPLEVILEEQIGGAATFESGAGSRS